MAKFVEMQVDSIRVHMPSGQHVVILKEKETDRYLPIWIGIYEANAIALKITGITPERPITHDLLANILQSAEMRLKKIQVTSLTNEVFFARLFLAVNGKEVEIDSRPSDAIALAVRMTCPILVSQDVLDQAGVFAEKEEAQAGKPARSYQPPKIGVPFQLSTPTGLRATPRPLRTSVRVSPWLAPLSDVDGDPINWAVTCMRPVAG